jgi:hypothetical protein
MDGMALLQRGIDESEGQLRRTLAGLTNATIEFRPHPSAMALGEHLVHLIESYIAVQAENRGETHEWGSFHTDLKDFDELVAELFVQRKLAVDTLTKAEAILVNGLFFFAHHDAYHIGQLCLLRQAFDKNWSSFSIYSEES